MNKHTPGPWEVSFNGKGTWTIEEVGGNHQYVARTERQQDARLIAAAPELLEHLKKLVGHLDARDAAQYHGSTEIVKQARVAIAKAEGKEEVMT